jgi:hypothetical protein
LLGKRNHIEAAYRQHLAVAGGYARRDRIEQTNRLKVSVMLALACVTQQGRFAPLPLG